MHEDAISSSVLLLFSSLRGVSSTCCALKTLLIWSLLGKEKAQTGSRDRRAGGSGGFIFNTVIWLVGTRIGEEPMAGCLSRGGGFTAFSVELRFTQWLFLKSPQNRKTLLPTRSPGSCLHSVGMFCLTVLLNSAVICRAINMRRISKIVL